MKNLDYRKWSTTLRLVIAVWIVATAMFIAGWFFGGAGLSEEGWIAVTVGGLFGWVLRDLGTKGAEAYRDARLATQPYQAQRTRAISSPVPQAPDH